MKLMVIGSKSEKSLLATPVSPPLWGVLLAKKGKETTGKSEMCFSQPSVSEQSETKVS
jgi:hypothetical protein